MTNIVLIHGKKRAGKDYFAKILGSHLEVEGKTVKIMAFADPIKEILATSLSISVEELNRMKNEKSDIVEIDDNYDQWVLTDTRRLIQNFGTEAMHTHFGKDVWVNMLKRNAQMSKVDYVLVPDFRFLHENISSTTIRIQNDEIDNACDDNHTSENELKDFEFKYTIDNTGYPLLHDKVKSCIKDLNLQVLSVGVWLLRMTLQ